jgi:hypothetical protein
LIFADADVALTRCTEYLRGENFVQNLDFDIVPRQSGNGYLLNLHLEDHDYDYDIYLAVNDEIYNPNNGELKNGDRILFWGMASYNRKNAEFKDVYTNQVLIGRKYFRS